MFGPWLVPFKPECLAKLRAQCTLLVLSPSGLDLAIHVQPDPGRVLSADVGPAASRDLNVDRHVCIPALPGALLRKDMDSMLVPGAVARQHIGDRTTRHRAESFTLANPDAVLEC